jgi:two-component system sensor histidine kinase KdpD
MQLVRAGAMGAVGLRILRSLGCLAVISAVTWGAFFAPHVNALIVGFAYVLIVLVVAVRWGFIEALLTSIAAMLCLNFFFLPPVLSLTIADPQNWAALFAFLVTAVTASQLAANVRNRAAEAQARRLELEQLYKLSLSLMQIDAKADLARQVAALVKEVFGFLAVAFCDAPTAEIHVVGVDNPGFDADVLRSAAGGNGSWSVSRSPGLPAVVIPVALGPRPLGSLGVAGNLPSEAALQAITNLAAVAIEHARQHTALGKLEIARQNERLRGVLLDALAHDFLTPLTSIKGAISTVRSEYDHGDEEGEFLAIVEEETDKLGEMINETTDMARIEPGNPRIRLRELAVADLIESALKRMKSSLDGRPVEINIQSNMSMINGDPEMLGLALRQLIGNASKYSPVETTIEILAFGSDDSAIVQVRDHGPGIASDEIESIFERFYRGKQAQESVAGTGMGLSIARDIINAHHGKIWVENIHGGGAQFSLRLPAFRGSQRT